MITFSKLGNFGRMGNALFQASASISLALENNDKYGFPHWKYENSFNLKNCFYDKLSFTQVYKEPFFHYQKIEYQANLDLEGYFQSELYFSKNKDIILNLLTPKLSFGKKWGTTSIHVRRGDYLNLQDYHPTQPIEYYKKAMDMIKSKNYLIVSDDIPWCKQNFIGEQFIFSEGENEITDLALQIACEHNIISNSSFSWWGAYLNKSSSKIVVAPNNWFGPKLPHNIKDLLPTDWKII